MIGNQKAESRKQFKNALVGVVTNELEKLLKLLLVTRPTKAAVDGDLISVIGNQ